jgi:hypothetical protein
MHGVHGVLCLAYVLCIHLTIHSHQLQFIETLLTLPLLIFMLYLNNKQHNRHRNMDTAEMSDRFEQHQRLKLHVQSMRMCSFRAVGVMRAMARLSPALRAHQGTHYLPHHTTLSRQSVLHHNNSFSHYCISYSRLQTLLLLNNVAVVL